MCTCPWVYVCKEIIFDACALHSSAYFYSQYISLQTSWYIYTFISYVTISLIIFCYYVFMLCCAMLCYLSYSCILFVPVDVIKERMQIQSLPSSSSTGVTAAGSIPSCSSSSATMTSPFYKNSYDAVCTIARDEGIRGIYRGYAATLLSFGPFSALYFTFYEEVSE